MHEALMQQRDESAAARVERAQQALERVLVLIANSEDALGEAIREIKAFEAGEFPLVEFPSDAAATDLIGSTIDEAICVTGAVCGLAQGTVRMAYEAVLHNSGRMQYWLEQETHGNQLT